MSRKRKAKPLNIANLNPTVTATTEKLLGEFNISPTEWDALIVGDGSGSGWNNACGWSSVLVDRRSALRKLFCGAMNAGTSYISELIPYVQAATWYMEGPGRHVLHEKQSVDLRATLNVHIITDNEVVARQGTGKAKKRKCHLYWVLLEGLESLGMSLHWHWMRRSTSALNRVCDYLAGLSRQSIEVVNQVQPPEGLSIYDFNSDKQPDVLPQTDICIKATS